MSNIENEDSGLLIWRLRQMMAERNIRSGNELQRRLHQEGVQISSSQINRMISELPKRLPTDLLAALLNILDCTACDLIQRMEPAAASPRPATSATPAAPRAPAPKAPAPRKAVARPASERAPKRPTKAADSNEDIAGPNITPLPIGKKKG